MYDPMNPPAEGIPADPLPDDLPEGDSGEVTDEGVESPIFVTDDEISPQLQRGFDDANAGRTVNRQLRSDIREAHDDT